MSIWVCVMYVSVVYTRSIPVNLDDELGRAKTDSEGRFSIDGSGRDIGSTLDPVLYVYHDCNDKTETLIRVPKPCQRKWRFTLPDRYVNEGVMDIGRINLEMKLKDEDRDCFNLDFDWWGLNCRMVFYLRPIPTYRGKPSPWALKECVKMGF